MTDPTPMTAAEVQAKIDEAVSGLKDKNAELIADNKKLKVDLRKVQDIKPEDMAALESDNEKLRADLSTATASAKAATTERDKAVKALAEEQGVTHKLIAENGLVAELTKAGVTDPAYLDAVKALHLGNVKVVADGDTRKALYGDKPLADAIKEWAGSDIGKRFVAAPGNSGGGAPGGRGGKNGAKRITESEFNSLSAKDRAAYFDAGGVIESQAA